jgi:hypothetical protein
MKQPKNKLKAVYLIWIFLHAWLWAIATNNGNKNRFFPLAYPDDYYKHYIDDISYYQVDGTSYFQVNDVYDKSEFLFYASAPILIYYAILFWKGTIVTNDK